MRKTIMSSAAMVVAIIAIWGATVFTAHSPTASHKAATSIGVMEMMKSAKNLPDERFDAH